MSIFLSSLLLYLREARSTSSSLQHVSVHKLGSCQHTAQRKKQKGSSKPRAVSGSHPEHTGKEKEGCNFLKCSVSVGPHFHAPVLNAWADSETASTPRTPVWLFGLFQMFGSFFLNLITLFSIFSVSGNSIFQKSHPAIISLLLSSIHVFWGW